MAKGSREVRIQEGGVVTASSRAATRELAARSGTWTLEDGPSEVLLMRRTEGAFADATMRLAGQVRVAGAICDVLAMIGQSGWSGSLIVVDETGTRTLELDSGRVVAAASTVRLERFGELVYRFGLASREQIDNARDASAISGTSLAEALAELGVVSSAELEPAQLRHVQEIFYAVVRVHDGAFYFFDKRLLGHELPRPHPTAIELLMEGARRMDEILMYRHFVPSSTHVPEAAARMPPARVLDEHGAKLGITGGEILQIVERCNGKRSVADVGRHLGMLEYEITQALAFLVQNELVLMRAPRPRGPEQITEVFNSAIVEIHRSCDRCGVGDELREGLKRFVGGSPVVAQLVQAAGPLDDGSFVPERVGKNLMARPSNEPVARLVKAMQDYLGFALFLGTSLVPRDESVHLKGAVQRSLSPIERVSYSIAPASMGPPPNAAARVRVRVPTPLPRIESFSGEFLIGASMPSVRPPSKASPSAPVEEIKSSRPRKSGAPSPPSSKGRGSARSR